MASNGNAKKQMKTSRERSEFLWGWLFILPTVIGLVVLNIIPIFQTLYQSFFKTGDFGKGNIFVGLDNYAKVFGDHEVWQSLINTFKYAIVEVPFSIIIALVLAVLLNRKMKGRGIYRTIIFLPMVAAPAAVAMVWRWLFNSDFGLLNNVFHTNVKWVSDPGSQYSPLLSSVYGLSLVTTWYCLYPVCRRFPMTIMRRQRLTEQQASRAFSILQYPCYPPQSSLFL